MQGGFILSHGMHVQHYTLVAKESIKGVVEQWDGVGVPRCGKLEKEVGNKNNGTEWANRGAERWKNKSGK